MANPRDNLTTRERWWQQGESTYIYGLDLVDSDDRKSRFWFRTMEDRQAFADVFNSLYNNFGHSTKAVLVERGGHTT